MHVGITGHQRLDKSTTWNWVSAAMQAELLKIAPPLVGVTSLAIGADQLFARLILQLGGTIHAVLPYADIESSFTAEDVPAFRELLNLATVEVLPKHGMNQDAYLAAGKRVVDLSNLVLAVWDGRPAKGKGGTADIVSYAIQRSIPVIHFDPVSSTVRHVS